MNCYRKIGSVSLLGVVWLFSFLAVIAYLSSGCSVKAQLSTNEITNGTNVSSFADDTVPNERVKTDTAPYYFLLLGEADLDAEEPFLVRVHSRVRSEMFVSSGVLIRTQIVSVCCTCVLPYGEEVALVNLELRGGINDRGIEHGHSIEVLRALTGEKRDVEEVTYGTRPRCGLDQLSNFEAGLILSKPFETDPVFVMETLDQGELCRFYTFFKTPEKGPMAILQLLELKVFNFFAKVNCDYASLSIGKTCGEIIDDHQEFCNLTAGAIVLCDGRLLGISETSCDERNDNHYSGKSEIVVNVSMAMEPKITYWESLVKRDTHNGIHNDADIQQALAVFKILLIGNAVFIKNLLS